MNMELIESANMLIMALAHAQASGDGSLISQHVKHFFLENNRHLLINHFQLNLLQTWAEFLVNEALYPEDQ